MPIINDSGWQRRFRLPRRLTKPARAAAVRPAVMAATIGALVCSLLVPFVDRDYSVNYQFDTPVFARHVAQFRRALDTGNLRRLPKLEAWPPYLDAYDVLLTALTAGTDRVSRLHEGLARALPTLESQTTFWERWLSLGFHAGGMAFLWLALMRVYARPVVALGLTLLVAIAPTVIDIDLGRNDWGVLGSLCAVLYFNIRCAQGDDRRGVLAGLGLAAALLVTMKVNGPAFAVFIVVPLALIALHRGRDLGRMGVLVGTFAVAVLMLSFRHVYYAGDAVASFAAQIADLGLWSLKSPKPSTFYYSWEILASQGPVYRIVVWASAALVACALLVRPTLTTLFVLATFAVFVAWSLIIDYGFARGGYHLLPMFALVIASAGANVEYLMRRVVRRRAVVARSAGVVMVALLAQPLYATSRNYAVRLAAVIDRPSAVYLTRTLPARFMAEAFPPGTRVVTPLRTTIALIPPILSHGFVFDDALFSPPTGLFDREPPSLEALRQTAGALVMSDFQEREMLQELERGEHPDRAGRWRLWFAMLRRDVPSVELSAPAPGYYYRAVEIFDLRPGSSVAALRAVLATIPSPVRVRDITAALDHSQGAPGQLRVTIGARAAAFRGRLEQPVDRAPAAGLSPARQR